MATGVPDRAAHVGDGHRHAGSRPHSADGHRRDDEHPPPPLRYLLPPSPREWLPPGHLSYFLLDVVGQMELAAIRARYERELRGMPPHDPQMMVTLLRYGYCVGVPSSRKIERKTHETWRSESSQVERTRITSRRAW